MAFSINACQSGTGAATTSPYVTSSATPSADSLLILGDGAQNNNHSTAQSHATPTGGGWTYTQIGSTPSQAYWAGQNVYATTGALWQAPVDSSPSAHTITVDAFSGTNSATYRPLACSITGHNTSSPITQYAQSAVDTQPGGGAGTNASGTIALGSTPKAGNLIVVYFFVCDDGGGPISSPTMGSGKTFTQLTQNSGGNCQSYMGYRVADGGEDTTITSSSLGTLVGNYYSAAIEIEADPGMSIISAWLTA